MSSADILHQLDIFRQMGSALYVAAHPDDENTELLAYLACGRKVRTAYLSLTRGDGGQNVLGPDLGATLGVARTQELLAARRIDGAQQFFSRAVDFGFSKSYSESLHIWNKEQVLSDMVRVIRKFRPDVIITRFSPSPGGTHGHHTASAVLAIEAFEIAGDPSAFPEQQLAPWQPKRVLWNTSTFQSEKINKTAHTLKIDVGGKHAVSGEPFTDLAHRSRSEHKTQEFDTFQFPGSHDWPRIASFQLLCGEPAREDIFDGIDTTWNRIAGGAEAEKLVGEIVDTFNPQDASLSVPPLLKLRTQLGALSESDPVVKEKQQLLDQIVQGCLGLSVKTLTDQFEVVPGEEMKLRHTAAITSSIPVRWVSVRYPASGKTTSVEAVLRNDLSTSREINEALPSQTPLTQPYWLQAEGTAGSFRVDDPNLIGVPENSPAFPVEHEFEVFGERLVVVDEPVQIFSYAHGHELLRKLCVIPPLALQFTTEAAIFTPSMSREVEVEIKGYRPNLTGTVELLVDGEWKVEPSKHSFDLTEPGEETKLKFALTSPNHAVVAKVIAWADLHGKRYCHQRKEVGYAHIPTQLLHPQAVLKAVNVQMESRSRNVGYLPGAGDTMVEDLEQIGCTVKTLDDANLTEHDLRELDAVVLGARVYNVRKHLATALPILFEFVRSGGTMVVQYNRLHDLQTDKLAPYDLYLSHDRVTDQNAPVSFLAPDHPVLNSPNKITDTDFDGWVQERGLYFPNRWDDRFTPILACNDSGEAPLKGSLLVARYGEGHFIYTGLSLFRQLPAGVPGAFRLLANLISLGK